MYVVKRQFSIENADAGQGPMSVTLFGINRLTSSCWDGYDLVSEMIAYLPTGTMPSKSDITKGVDIMEVGIPTKVKI